MRLKWNSFDSHLIVATIVLWGIYCLLEAASGSTVTLSPGSNLQAAINAAANGDTLILADGTYSGGANFGSKSGIAIKAINTGKAVIGGQIQGGSTISLVGVSVSGVSTPYQVGAVQVGDGWTMTDVAVSNYDSVGFKIVGSHVRATRCTASGGYMGWGAGRYDSAYATDIVLTDCAGTDCNTGVINPSWRGITGEAFLRNGKYFMGPGNEAGNKFCQVDGLTLLRFKGLRNCGPGLWLDVFTKSVNIIDADCQGNVGLNNSWEGPGIAVELCHGPTTITNPHAAGNTGSGIALWEASAVTINGGVLEANGIETRDLDDRGRTGYSCFGNVANGVKLFSGAKVSYWNNRTADLVLSNVTSPAGPASWSPGSIATTLPTPPVTPVNRISVTQLTAANAATAQIIVGSDAWTLTSGKQIAVNGVVQPVTSGVDGLYLSGGVLYQNAYQLWWSWSGAAWQSCEPPTISDTTQPTPTDPQAQIVSLQKQVADLTATNASLQAFYDGVMKLAGK